MFKKLSVILLALIMATMVTACGSSGETGENEDTAATESSEAMSGGWEIYDNEANVLPEDVQAAFDKAEETFTGSELKPVAYIASQVVAGTNYMILCEATTTTETPSTSYQMVIVYADLNGNAEITQMKEFDFAAYTEGDNSDISTEKLAGGWEIAEDRSSVVIPQDAKDAFDKAAENLDGNELEPMALLGTQVVAGTNYAVLSKASEINKGSKWVIIYLYQDLQGNASVLSIADVTLGV